MNQAACFRAACDALTRDILIERLGLPLPALHPEVRAIPSVTFDEQLVEGLRASEAELVASDPSVTDATGRLERTTPNGMVVLAGWGAGAASAIVLAQMNQLLLAVSLGVAIPILAWFLAPSRRFDVCADRSCATILAADTTRCPGCRRQIAARVASEADRLDV